MTSLRHTNQSCTECTAASQPQSITGDFCIASKIHKDFFSKKYDPVSPMCLVHNLFGPAAPNDGAKVHFCVHFAIMGLWLSISFFSITFMMICR